MDLFYLDGFEIDPYYQSRRPCSAIPLRVFSWSSLLWLAPNGHYYLEEATTMVFCLYCLPRLLPHSRKIKHTKTHAHFWIKKSDDNFYVWFLTQKTLLDMFYTLTSLPSMVIILLCFYLDSSAGFCMPCHEINKKTTLWDLDCSFSTRGRCYVVKGFCSVLFFR